MEKRAAQQQQEEYSRIGIFSVSPVGGTQGFPPDCYISVLLLCARTALHTDNYTWDDGSRFALTADHPTRTLTRTLWGDQCLDAVA